MKTGHSSRTAEYMALFRALETLRPADRRLFEDKLAATFLGPRLRMMVALARLPGLGDWVRGSIDRRWPGPRTSAVARTRYIDDATTAALTSDIEQAVILGAGFDCRAYRLPSLGRVHVFEVDHPSTSMIKSRKVSKVFRKSHDHVHFVHLDFNTDSLQNAMKVAGFDARLLTLVIWEGVSHYLTAQAVDSTLRWCSSLAKGSKLIFTYVHQRVLEAPEAFDGTEKLFGRLAAMGEQWTFGLDPAYLRTFLVQRGLMLEDDCGAREYRARYYGNEAMAMSGYEFYRIATARVAGS